MSENLEAIIGLEIHAQIALQSKMFCSCSSNSFNQEPNINTCPVCMGFPGQLPVINKLAVKKGIKAALALNCSIASFSKFDRKNYFYPDLPKGFQISQYDKPISSNGWIEIEIDGQKKKIGIERLHLEDDAGKLTHITDGTLCDYNRSGIALMEIVSKPDIRNALEASLYAKNIQTILRYVGASEADMEKGMMRFDASVSLRRQGENILNPRAEIKNLNSFRSLETAINYEIQRQTNLWKEGKPLQNHITVGWNEIEQKTYFLRDKEGAEDYRYFPEPDLPPLIITPEMIESLQAEIPELPSVKNKKYQEEFKISAQEAELISSDLKLAQYFEETIAICNDPKKASSFLTSILLGFLHKDDINIEETKVTPVLLGKLINLINQGKISTQIAKGTVFESMYQEGKDPEEIIKEKGLSQMNDQNELEKICKEVIETNEKSVQDYKNGKQAALQFLVGQVMKKTRGQADANLVQQIFTRLLSS